MSHLKDHQRLLLPSFSESPSKTCETCTTYYTTLEKVEISARSGCHFCMVLREVVEKFPPLGLLSEDHNLVCIWPPLWESRPHLELATRRTRDGDYSTKTVREIGIYTQVGETTCSWPAVGVRRNIAKSRELTYLDPVMKWIQMCDTNHHDCLTRDTPLPTRVLDVSAPTESNDQIHLNISENGECSRYIALSYCWGGSVPLQTTTDTFEARKSGIPLGMLPKTFQDAVTVVRDLGVRYLWIDALCILQDNKEDWEIESSNMAAIYKNAYVVIAADMSANCDSGFLHREYTIYDDHQKREIRRGHPEQIVAEVKESETSTSVVYARRVNFHKNPFACHNWKRDLIRPLGTRAWAFQEQLLAARTIHFMEDELIWECRSCLLCECMDIESENSHTGTFNRIKGLYNECLMSEDPVKALSTWNDLLDNYMSRDITNKMDCLPALSGIARELHNSRRLGRYLGGLWSYDLPHSLLWAGNGNRTQRVVPYRAPSWSWACLEESCHPLKEKFRYIDSQNFVLSSTWSRIHEATCTPSGKDDFGTVSDGHITITAPFLEVSHKLYKSRVWAWDKTYDDLLELKPRGVDLGRFSSIATYDFELRLPKKESLYWLFIGGSGEINRVTLPGIELLPSTTKGLILRQKQRGGINNEPVFERVGIFQLSENNWAADYPNVCKELIKIVQGSADKTVTIV